MWGFLEPRYEREVPELTSTVHATWCGPCKTIAPVFESLAEKHATPGKIAFASCDIDQNQDIATTYGVRSIPTFIIFKNKAEAERIQPTSRNSLVAPVERYVAEAKAAPAAIAGKGYTLGAAPTQRYVRNGQMLDSLPLGARLRSWVETVIIFLGLYFTSLLSLDAIPAARNSMFANYGKARENNPGSGRGGGIGGSWGSGGSGGGGPGGPGGPGGRKLGTMGNVNGKTTNIGGGCSGGSCG
ncbi:hypothetical protein RUND412_005175 [Rhizina undulata]